MSNYDYGYRNMICNLRKEVIVLGANCSRPVATVKEGIQFITKMANSETCLQPDGDACILNTKTQHEYYYRMILVIPYGQINSGREYWKAKRIHTKSAKVKPILPTVAGIYGKKPTPKHPFVAMIRLD